MEDFYYDRDPLRLELLPEGWERRETALRYRSGATRGREYRNPFAPYIIASLAVIGGVLASVLHNYVLIPKGIGFPEVEPSEYDRDVRR